jgi:hypothetical protein
MQIAGKDAGGSWWPTGCQLRELVYYLVRPSGNVVELEAIELVLRRQTT